MATLTAPRPAVKTRKPASDSHGKCGLTLSIAGVRYRVRPNHAAPEMATRAFRLTKADGTAYDVAATPHGLACDCPDWTFRHDGQGTLCKHLGACVAVGLLARPTPPEPKPRRTRTASPKAKAVVTPEAAKVIDKAPEPAVVADAYVAACREFGPDDPRTNPTWDAFLAMLGGLDDATHATIAADVHAKVAAIRKPAPCCNPIEAEPCMACVDHQRDNAPGEGFASELAKAVDPTILDDPDDSDPDTWPAWTDSDVWVPIDSAPGDDGPGDDGARLDLEAWVRGEADRYRRMGHDAGDLLARVLSNLADEIDLTQAKDVPTYEARILALQFDHHDA